MALIGQARNSDPSYGQGLRGYAKRFGTFYANTGIGTLMTNSVLPTLLHQDSTIHGISGTLSHTVSVWGTDVMLNALFNVAKEFWPDIRRKIHKQKKLD